MIKSIVSPQQGLQSHKNNAFENRKRSMIIKQNQFFPIKNNANRHIRSNSKGYFYRLSSKDLFKQARLIRGETFLKESQASSLFPSKLQKQKQTSSKLSIQNKIRHTKSDSKLGLNKVLDVNVDPQVGDLTALIDQFGQSQQPCKLQRQDLLKINEDQLQFIRLSSKKQSSQTIKNLIEFLP